MPSEQWTSEEYQEWERSGKCPDRYRVPGKNGQLEPDSRHEAGQADALQEVVSEYRITVYHYRHRLADFDNLCTKYFLDAIVDSGLLPGDTPDKVIMTHKQIKIPTTLSEKTVFEIERNGER